MYVTLQSTKHKISRLLAIEEEKLKNQQDLLSSSEEKSDESANTAQSTLLYTIRHALRVDN